MQSVRRCVNWCVCCGRGSASVADLAADHVAGMGAEEIPHWDAIPPARLDNINGAVGQVSRLLEGTSLRLSLSFPVELLGRCICNAMVSLTEGTDVGKILKQLFGTKLGEIQESLELDTVLCVALAGPGRAVSGSEDKTLNVWDLAAGTCERTLAGHPAIVTGVAACDPAPPRLQRERI
ncbi:unnamed protein product [Prorocentrum cordatum]|uniref:Uncharacterized protein n=1 Tax=Prorocentrum cordatum TaxID=2364126 RepID=A0ABN9STI7_9DINO|nr:unnamed protein product [Polarella glacialis]